MSAGVKSDGDLSEIVPVEIPFVCPSLFASMPSLGLLMALLLSTPDI